MPGKPMLRLIKLANDVRAFADSNAERLARRVAEDVASGAPKGTKIPALDSLLVALGGALARSVADVESAEATVDAEAADVPPVIERRDAQAEKLRARVVRLRDVLRLAAGPNAVRKAGFLGDTPFDPEAIARVANTAIASLKSQPPTLDDDVKVDLPKLTKGISDLAAELLATIAEVRAEGREVQAARVDRDRKLEVAERQLRGLAMVLEGLCVFAGEEALGERVRPATRKSADEPEGDEPAPTPAE
jgi:hypothetical protein